MSDQSVSDPSGAGAETPAPTTNLDHWPDEFAPHWSAILDKGTLTVTFEIETRLTEIPEAGLIPLLRAAIVAQRGKAVELLFIVSGNAHLGTYSTAARVRTVIADVLANTGNIGRTLDEWELRNNVGVLIDPGITLGAALANYSAEGSLWLSPRAGCAAARASSGSGASSDTALLDREYTLNHPASGAQMTLTGRQLLANMAFGDASRGGSGERRDEPFPERDVAPFSSLQEAGFAAIRENAGRRVRAGESSHTLITDAEVSAFTEAYFKRDPAEDFEEFASPPNIQRRVRRALNALLAARAGSGESSGRSYPQEWVPPADDTVRIAAARALHRIGEWRPDMLDAAFAEPDVPLTDLGSVLRSLRIAAGVHRDAKGYPAVDFASRAGSGERPEPSEADDSATLDWIEQNGLPDPKVYDGLSLRQAVNAARHCGTEHEPQAAPASPHSGASGTPADAETAADAAWDQRLAETQPQLDVLADRARREKARDDLLAAIKAAKNASFDCGAWEEGVEDADGKIEDYETVRERSIAAYNRVVALVDQLFAELRSVSPASGDAGSESVLSMVSDAIDRLAQARRVLESYRESSFALDQLRVGLGILDKLRTRLAAARVSRDGGTPPTPDVQTLWRWAYALNLVAARYALELRNAEQREAGEEENWPAQQSWSDLGGSSRSSFLRAAREAAGIDHDAFLGFVRGEHGDSFVDIADAIYDRADAEPLPTPAAAPSLSEEERALLERCAQEYEDSGFACDTPELAHFRIARFATARALRKLIARRAAVPDTGATNG